MVYFRREPFFADIFLHVEHGKAGEVALVFFQILHNDGRDMRFVFPKNTAKAAVKIIGLTGEEYLVDPVCQLHRQHIHAKSCWHTATKILPGERQVFVMYYFDHKHLLNVYSKILLECYGGITMMLRNN